MIGRPYAPGDSIGDYRLDPPPCDDHEPDPRCLDCGEPSEDSICDDCWFGEQVEADLEMLVEQWGGDGGAAVSRAFSSGTSPDGHPRLSAQCDDPRNDAELGAVLGAIYGAAHVARDIDPHCVCCIEVGGSSEIVSWATEGWAGLVVNVSSADVFRGGPIHRDRIRQVHRATRRHLDLALSRRP